MQRGSTAGSIARQMAAQQGVSYDQMLAALVRQNPDAFIGGNVNRIKAGAVLQTPSAEQATSVSQSEAKRQWMASGNNFKQYRRRLAQMDGSSVDANAGRTSRGAVAGEAADQGSTKAAGDKLTLGKARASRRNTEDQVLRKRHRAESSARQAELSKNIEELKKLSGATGKAAAPAAAHEAAAVNAAPKKNAPGLSVAAPILSAKTEAQKAQAKQETSMTAAPAVSATPTPSPLWLRRLWRQRWLLLSTRPAHPLSRHRQRMRPLAQHLRALVQCLLLPAQNPAPWRKHQYKSPC